MKIYKITKQFQGGADIYFATLPKSLKVKHGYWQHQLDEWGERTNGGHCYGWRIKVSRTSKYPKVEKIHIPFNPNHKIELRRADRLYFNEYFLEKVKRNKK